MKEGDIVKQVNGFVPFSKRDQSKKLGVVVKSFKGEAGVEWYDLRAGHNCNGRCKQGDGWFIPTDCLELVEEY